MLKRFDRMDTWFATGGRAVTKYILSDESLGFKQHDSVSLL